MRPLPIFSILRNTGSSTQSGTLGRHSFWNPGRIGWLAGASTALLLLGMLFWQSLSLRAESRRLAESAPGKLPGERAAIEFPLA